MMIPKSVSVSMRIVALVLLILPTQVWPGERIPAGDGCNTCEKSQNGILICTSIHCAVKDSAEQSACEQHMREAMARMAVLIQKENRGSLTLEYERTQGQWAKTMKDCVEGR